ncbi:alpha-latroinsectotoxin-lt1a [Quercus suber]|uniref:Alpha-latroinsectotoxin-lt1a n=1 Tax=Quercus suber TaxID=58331 RepID=A0AAW0J873_QUESU
MLQFLNIDSFIEKIGGGVLSLEQVTPGQIPFFTWQQNLERSSIRFATITFECLKLQRQTALHITASLGHFDLAELLITRASKNQEADVETVATKSAKCGEEHSTASCCKHGHYDIVELLIKEDPGLTSVTNDARESPLFLAVDRGLFEIALHILEIPKCSEEGRNNMNVLHAAIIRAEISKYLQICLLDVFFC